MALNLARAPLVIAQRKTTNIRILGEPLSKRDTLVVDMNKQSLADIQWMLKAITIDDTAAEIRKGNEPTRLVVDAKETTYLAFAQRKVEVTFGNFLDQLLIRLIQRQLMSAIRSYAVSPKDAALGTMANWGWAYAAKRGEAASPVNVTAVTSLPVGSYLILKPTSNQVGLANMFAARKDAGKAPDQWWDKGRSGGRGFMSKSLDTLKRSRLMKNYTIHVVFTKRFQTPGEKYSHGTPVVVLRARRNRGYKRIRVVP
jgi:hypothetical protein